MKQKDIFAIILRRNQESLLSAIEGLSHLEMFLQLPGDGMLVDSGLRSYMQPDEVQMYAGGSSPIKAGDICVDCARLTELIDITFSDLMYWLENENDGLRQAPVGNRKDNIGYSGVCSTLTEHFAQNIGHESIHVGELNPLRELALERRK